MCASGDFKMIYCKDDEITIKSDVFPKTRVRTILATYTAEQKRDIRKKPYLNETNVFFSIDFDGEEYRLFIPKDYTWDGASIPALFRPLIGGKGKQEFLIPSMVHDKMCENHYLIGNNRELSSLIFKKLLLACGVGKLRAEIMYLAVDLFQRTQNWG